MTDQPPTTEPAKPTAPIILHMHTMEPAGMVSITPKDYDPDDHDMPWLANVYHYPASGLAGDFPEHWEWEIIPPDGQPLSGVAMTNPAELLDDLIQRSWNGTEH